MQQNIQNYTNDGDYATSERGDERVRGELAVSSSGRVAPVIRTERRERTRFMRGNDFAEITQSHSMKAGGVASIVSQMSNNVHELLYEVTECGGEREQKRQASMESVPIGMQPATSYASSLTATLQQQVMTMPVTGDKKMFTI
jgi:hypothetical protein